MSWSHSSIHTQAQSLIKGGSETSEILKLNFKSHCTSVAELQLNENHNDLDLSSFTDQVSKFLCDHHLVGPNPTALLCPLHWQAQWRMSKAAALQMC